MNQPEPDDPTQCSGEEGFCPEHGFHRHTLKQPGTADRAAVLAWAADFAEEVAEKLRAHHEFERSTGALDVMTELRRLADEGVTPPPTLTEEGRLRARVETLTQDLEQACGLAKVGARCLREGHQGQIEEGRVTLQGWQFALATALGLDMLTPWEAIHERVQELRRLADEAQQQPDDRGPWGTRPRCNCPHAADEHSVYGCLDGCACEWMPKRPPMDPVHILGIDAQPPGPADEAPQSEPPVHAVPLPGSNGISACCGRPPCEFVGERVTRDPDKVTCTGPTAGAGQDGAQQ